MLRCVSPLVAHSGHHPPFSLPSWIGGAWVPNLHRERINALALWVSIWRCSQNAPGRGGKLFSRHWRAFSCAVSNAVVILLRRRYSTLYRRRYSALYWRRYSAPSALACFAIFSTLLRYGVTIMIASIAFTSEKLVLWKSHLCEAHHTQWTIFSTPYALASIARLIVIVYRSRARNTLVCYVVGTPSWR